MRIRGAGRLREHWHVLLIVPLVVIVVTWPTFANIFDAEEFWLHTRHQDKWLRLWDAWRLETALAGQTSFFHSNSIFHPQGLSLAMHAISLPHAFLLLALQNLIPADSVYNLLFLLMLCFNAICAYVLIQAFDIAGNRVLGQDAVIGNISLDRQRIDISSLSPGDYTVKLILYNFDTGASVSGTVSDDGARIDRAVEVGTIHQN